MPRLFCALAMACAFVSSAWAQAPARVVSLDYCADQFVLALADRGQIAAVSNGALREDSYFRSRARGLRQTRGSLEEVLALEPDLVVRNWGGPWDAEAVYARFGVPVLQVGDATDFTAARIDLVDAAARLGHSARGEAMAQDLDSRLVRLAARAPREGAPMMYLSAGGAVAGSGVLMDAVLRAGGGRNIWNEASWSVLPLERMIETPPALIALGFFDTGRTAMSAWSPSHHPAVQRALAGAHTVELPAAAISCEAWFAVDAAETIADALQAAP